MGDRVDNAARDFAFFAVALWAVAAVAGACMALGHPAAINVVLGCGAPGSFAAYFSWVFHRQDRRHLAHGLRRQDRS